LAHQATPNRKRGRRDVDHLLITNQFLTASQSFHHTTKSSRNISSRSANTSLASDNLCEVAGPFLFSLIFKQPSDLTMSRERLQGGCSCGRNRYIIQIPSDATEKPQVFFDSSHSHRPPPLHSLCLS
jgi:hypothetical protein